MSVLSWIGRGVADRSLPGLRFHLHRVQTDGLGHRKMHLFYDDADIRPRIILTLLIFSVAFQIIAETSDRREHGSAYNH